MPLHAVISNQGTSIVVCTNMQGSKESEALPFSEAMVNHASVVFEVALPPETPVIRLAQQRGKTSAAQK
jgi:shikimate dehydrogenase